MSLCDNCEPRFTSYYLVIRPSENVLLRFRPFSILIYTGVKNWIKKKKGEWWSKIKGTGSEFWPKKSHLIEDVGKNRLARYTHNIALLVVVFSCYSKHKFHTIFQPSSYPNWYTIIPIPIVVDSFSTKELIVEVLWFLIMRYQSIN